MRTVLEAEIRWNRAGVSPGFFSEMQEIVRYRSLLASLVHRELTVRYRRSALGFVWTMLHPLILAVTMTIVFSTVFRFALPHYSVYFLSEYVGWAFFSQTVVQSMTSMPWNGTIMKHVRVPRTIFVVAATLAGAIHMVLAIVAVGVIMLATGAGIHRTVVFLPVGIVVLGVFTLGVASIASAVSVFFADARELIQAVLPAVMYLTPIIYPMSIVPQEYAWLFEANPLLYLLQLLRGPLYDGVIPEARVLGIALAAAGIAFIAGWQVFNRMSRRFHPYL